MPVTPKKAAFVAAYVIEPNATKAALAAGYSPATAKQQGSRLLTDVDVVNMLNEAHATAVQVVAQRTGEAAVTATAVLERAWQIASSDARDRVPALVLASRAFSEFRDAAPTVEVNVLVVGESKL